MILYTKSNRTHRKSTFYNIETVEVKFGIIRIVHDGKVTQLGESEHKIVKIVKEATEE